MIACRDRSAFVSAGDWADWVTTIQCSPSETVGPSTVVGAAFIREVEPGELVAAGFSRANPASVRPYRQTRLRVPCQSLRNTSIFSPSRQRVRTGAASMKRARRSARSWRSRPRASPIWSCRWPDSGGALAAIGFAQQIGVPFELGDHPHALCRAHLHPAHRTARAIRASSASTTPTVSLVAGKRIVG